LREIQNILSDLEIQLLTPKDAGIQLNVLEDGETYAANAARKALAFARVSNLLSLADDSGLEVEALDGAPGLHSARFSPQPGPRMLIGAPCFYRIYKFIRVPGGRVSIAP